MRDCWKDQFFKSCVVKMVDVCHDNRLLSKILFTLTPAVISEQPPWSEKLVETCYYLKDITSSFLSGLMFFKI